MIMIRRNHIGWSRSLDSNLCCPRGCLSAGSNRSRLLPLVADVNEQNGAVELGFFNRATVYRLRMRSGAFAPRRMAVPNRCGMGGEALDLCARAQSRRSPGSIHTRGLAVGNGLLCFLQHDLGCPDAAIESR